MQDQTEGDRLTEDSKTKTPSEIPAEIASVPEVKAAPNSGSKRENSLNEAQIGDGLSWRPVERWHLAVNISTGIFVLCAAII